MQKRTRMTTNAGEADIASLLSGDSIFSIPYFQRPYKWDKNRIETLNKDILNIVDEEIDFHFLGAIIIHGRKSNPTDPKVYDVIDGQQRLTTLYLHITAAVEALSLYEHIDDASSLFLKYLAIPRDTYSSNFKLHPCKEDRAQFNSVLKKVLSNGDLCRKLSAIKPKYMQSSGNNSGKLTSNYKRILGFYKEQYAQGSIERIKSIYSSLLANISIVQIDVEDPTNGPKIFDSLNSKQQPMTIGDLVRNEVFSKAIYYDNYDVDAIENIDNMYWQPFYEKFTVGKTKYFDSYFFPYGLVLCSSLKKSEVYKYLSNQWRSLDPKEIIDNLSVYQNAFIDIVTGQNTQNHTPEVAAALNKLSKSKPPSSVYPFLMKLSHETSEKTVSKEDACDCISLIESFLVRRAVCGIEPTGLHAVFKMLWDECKDNLKKDVIRNAIRKHKTVAWPSNQLFTDAILERDLYSIKMVKYILTEYDISLGGDSPNIDPWIEHVLPQSNTPEWSRSFTKIDHGHMKDRLANLILLKDKMNKDLSNKPYSVKRPIYIKDSSFKCAREFGEKYTDWTPELLESRGKELAEWAVKRWPE